MSIYSLFIRSLQILIAILCFGTSSIYLNATLPPLDPNTPEPKEIIINNRIVARVGEKTISILDIVKQMDLFIHAHHPDIEKSNLARYQFYKTNWRDVLEQLIDAELVLADSKDKDLHIAESEIREELLERFGPNIMETIDRCGLTYDEAQKIVRNDLTVQRMYWFKVHAKTLQKIGPEDIRRSYQEYLAEHPKEEEWTYDVIAIRSPIQGVAEDLAKTALSLLTEAKIDLTTLSTKLEAEKTEDKPFTVSISSNLVATEKTISKAHQEGLMNLQEGECSLPILQVSGNDNRAVERLFFLKQHVIKQPPTFSQLKDLLQQNLINKLVQKEMREYRERLKTRFNHILVLEPIPPIFEPFLVRF